ncbi:VOC family protein [Marinococcus halophilus]|uniref:VOC family protein n=1 Tax=Marinococcus halophilus TaxID=1371 RepID=UPI0009A8C969|nr:VOC family protein [Marinococcus halophilus]
MNSVEIDLVVPDSLQALEVYKKIFEIKTVEASDFPRGENEVIFTLYGVPFHLLDENPAFHLIAPTPHDPKTLWFNITVPNIEETYAKAIDTGCSEVQAVTNLPEHGVSNAVFMDPFGYVWMLHQVYEEVSHEERKRLWEEKRAN